MLYAMRSTASAEEAIRGAGSAGGGEPPGAFAAGGKLESVCARGKLSLGETEKIFMNGYQTWTYCPEYAPTDYTQGVGPLPELLIRGLGLRSYGDYDFVPIPSARDNPWRELVLFPGRGALPPLCLVGRAAGLHPLPL